MGQGRGTGAAIVGVLATAAAGVIIVASIYQLNKGSIPGDASTTTTKVVGDLFS